MASSKINLTRFIIFLVVAGLHIILLLFFVINIEVSAAEPEQQVQVMKLTAIQEEEPPPPPPKEEPLLIQTTLEAVAETMIETDVVPEQIVVAAPQPQRVETEVIAYLPMHKISVPPSFSEREIRQALVYPPIALRSGIEGTVYLELFVDKDGLVRNITVLREDPPDRGFGEAAARAFRGLKGVPAQANGDPVAVRYRYPVRFSIRG
jgi:protein TonB